MKIPEQWQWAELRHKLVFTPEEKRVIIFVAAALLLGVTTRSYRESHPVAHNMTDKKHSASARQSANASEKRD